MMAKLRAEDAQRQAAANVRKRTIVQPDTISIPRPVYDLFVRAMRVVNRRIGVPAPPYELYTFKGLKLRCFDE